MSSPRIKRWISVPASQVRAGTVVQSSKGPIIIRNIAHAGDKILFSTLFQDTEVACPIFEALPGETLKVQTV